MNSETIGVLSLLVSALAIIIAFYQGKKAQSFYQITPTILLEPKNAFKYSVLKAFSILCEKGDSNTCSNRG